MFAARLFPRITAAVPAYTSCKGVTHMDDTPMVTLKKELMLRINENLFQKKAITKELYESAKMKIIALHT